MNWVLVAGGFLSLIVAWLICLKDLFALNGVIGLVSVILSSGSYQEIEAARPIIRELRDNIEAITTARKTFQNSVGLIFTLTALAVGLFAFELEVFLVPMFTGLGIAFYLLTIRNKITRMLNWVAERVAAVNYIVVSAIEEQLLEMSDANLNLDLDPQPVTEWVIEQNKESDSDTLNTDK